MKAFAYLVILLFIVIICFCLINMSLKRCPNKIKKFYIIALGVMLIRFLSLLSLWILDSQRIIYFIKVLTQLDTVGVPLLALGSFYIFLRDEKRSFDYNYIFMAIFFMGYFAINIMYKLNIKIDNVFGFVVNYKQVLVPSLIYLIVLSSILVITLFFSDKAYSNSKGLKLLLISLIITVVEFIIYLGGVKILPYPLIGEMCILGCSYVAISTFKIR